MRHAIKLDRLVRCALAALSLPIPALTSSPSIAQSASADDELEQVVVVAQRREERAQDVPIAIEAFSTKDLERSGVQSVQDLNVVTPGLNYGAFVGYAQPHLRGIGTTASGAGV